MKLFFLLFFLFSSCAHKQNSPLDETVSNQYMVTSQGVYTTEAAIKMFELGGNAFDAFAAASFTISVERPQSTGLGGGGFLVGKTKKDKTPFTLDFREKAPIKGNSKMFLDKTGAEIQGKSINGIFSVGVPGLVAGVLEIHEQYGKLSRQQVLGPAIELAQKGFEVYPELGKALEYRKDELAKHPSSKKIFFKDNRLLSVGDLLVQSDLAKTLKRISDFGKNEFYQGEIAKKIIEHSKKMNGILTFEDFTNYQTVKRSPVVGSLGNYKIYSMGPPSSGGIHIIQILNILKKFKFSESDFQKTQTIHKIAQAMQLAFADRSQFLGDTDFVKVPVKALTSQEYAEDLSEKMTSVALKQSSVAPGKPWPYESPETTHFTIADTEGNVISSTQTINGYFGSGVVAKGTGIVLNNEMDDFSTRPGASNLFGAIGGDKNLVEPQKRPLSSMSPTIIFDSEGKFKMALGSPSGTRILTCVAQVILNHLVFGKNLYESVEATRIHHQWSPDTLFVEAPYFPEKMMDELRLLGYDLQKKELGCRVQAISVNSRNQLMGVSDSRGEGMASGL
ncbi:MAG: gamma-glutamyltransferase [Halobacteriovoraceae bacterium]|nr:gamma-glutamyltransferase [Halobacteriovoraceae bacterium]